MNFYHLKKKQKKNIFVLSQLSFFFLSLYEVSDQVSF